MVTHLLTSSLAHTDTVLQDTLSMVPGQGDTVSAGDNVKIRS